MKTSGFAYTFLKEMVNVGDYNFYGIIYDATYPSIDDHSSYSQKMYECTIKLIDPSMNCLTNPSDIPGNIITLIIKSSIKECMPFIHSIGDIIRVHCGSYNPMKNTIKVILTGVTKIISNWCLFSATPNKDYHINNPYLSSNPNMANNENDMQILNGLRQWINNDFKIKNSLVYLEDIKLANRILKENNDATVQIAGKYEYSNDIFYILQDETDRCEIKTTKCFNFFEINDIIRLKGFKVNQSNQIEMKKDSNILMVPSFSDYHQEFTKKIEDNKQYLDIKCGALSLMKSYNDLTGEQQSNLSDLNMNMNFYPNDAMMMIDTPPSLIHLNNDEGLPVLSAESIVDSNNAHEGCLIEVKIEEVFPYPIEAIANVMCENCKSTYCLKDIHMDKEKFNCQNCLTVTNGKVHFNSYMKCKEKINDQIMIIHLCSYDDEGELFFGMKHCDLNVNDNGKLRKLRSNIKELIDLNSYIKIKVEAIAIDGDNNSSNTQQNKSRIYRLIGQYETNYSSESVI